MSACANCAPMQARTKGAYPLERSPERITPALERATSLDPLCAGAESAFHTRFVCNKRFCLQNTPYAASILSNALNTDHFHNRNRYLFIYRIKSQLSYRHLTNLTRTKPVRCFSTGLWLMRSTHSSALLFRLKPCRFQERRNPAGIRLYLPVCRFLSISAYPAPSAMLRHR